jgi:PPP family 3-phenylpropionic acid transporter
MEKSLGAPKGTPLVGHLGLSLYYAGFFLVGGVLAPFWPMFLSGRGLNATAIGILLALTLWVRALSGPALARLADAVGRPRLIVILATGFALPVLFAFFPARGFAALLALNLLFQTLFAGCLPLAEATALRAASAHRGYGRIRLWGSFSFVVAAIAGGFVLEGRVTLRPETILWLVILCIALVWLTTFALPDLRAVRSPRTHRPFRDLFRSRPFLLVIAAAGLIHGAHAILYGFGSLHWSAAGLPKWQIGLLWAEGTLAEIVLFAFGGRLVNRLGPVWLLALGGGTGTLRWGVIASTSSLAALVPIQLLHGLSFGAMHLGVMLYFARHLPDSQINAAQSLYAGLTNGAVMGACMMLAGLLFYNFGGAAFWAAAGLSALSLPLLWWLVASQPPRPDYAGT